MSQTFALYLLWDVWKNLFAFGDPHAQICAKTASPAVRCAVDLLQEFEGRSDVAVVNAATDPEQALRVWSLFPWG